MPHLPPITLSRVDLTRLEHLLDSPALRQLPAALALGSELARATVVEPEAMPGNVVTMNSRVTCVDETTGEAHTVVLSYPRDADVAAGRVSVLAPVGSALLGLAVGDRIDWSGPAGRPLRVRVDRVHYQPEAAGAGHR